MCGFLTAMETTCTALAAVFLNVTLAVGIGN